MISASTRMIPTGGPRHRIRVEASTIRRERLPSLTSAGGGSLASAQSLLTERTAQRPLHKFCLLAACTD